MSQQQPSKKHLTPVAGEEFRLWTPAKTNSVGRIGGGYNGGDVQIFAVSLNRAHILSTPIHESSSCHSIFLQRLPAAFAQQV